MGIRKARELTYSGEMINAAQALQMGLVNHVVPLADLMSTVSKKLEVILTRSPLAVAESKKSLNQGFDLETERALENEAQIFGALFTSADTKEGTRAFAEKRKPVFKGE